MLTANTEHLTENQGLEKRLEELTLDLTAADKKIKALEKTIIACTEVVAEEVKAPVAKKKRVYKKKSKK